MKEYCKAYFLAELRQFESWHDYLVEEVTLPDDAIVYLWDDFTVVKSPIVSEQEPLWRTVTPEWKTFCITTLHFAVPEDFRYTHENTPEVVSKKT